MPAPSFPFRIDFPPELPISARAEEIVATIQAHQVLILAGETGSGKTTQLPKMCLAAGRGVRGQIACTQPRRVAALSISRRVAEEMGVDWGREVGCKIRFNDQTSRDTVVKFLTDGMLLAEVQSDPLLRAYDTIIIDEAHERSLNIDFLLGHLRQLRFRRPELKIIITSATIDTEAFSKAFDDAPVIQVSGRTYPVEVIYAPLDELGTDRAEGDEATAKSEALHYIDGALEAVERILRESTTGDVLVFLPAERDIRELCDLLEGRRFGACDVVPLFGRLSNAEQQRVFAPLQRRKIVVATNIAETSLTIPGIHFVVDAGLARVSRYAPQSRTRRLPIEPVSQSSADQRKGRCGRVAAGVCIRLYSEADYNDRPRFTQPEIQRANLADVILRMKAFGLGDIERFPFINMPATKAVRAGYGLLDELGAIASERLDAARTTRTGTREREDEAPQHGAGAQPSPTVPTGEAAALAIVLTPLGRELARLPVDPTVGRMILQARTEKCVNEILVVAAGLSIQDPRERPLDAREKADAAHRRFIHPDSDFLTLLNIWEAFHDEFERLSQARLRRFCRDHFLSYTRMREWRDIHSQLVDVLAERKDWRFTSVHDGVSARQVAENDLRFGSPGYRALHRSILAGLLGNIAVRDDENGGYKATQDRRVALFPGSVLYTRDEPKKERREPGQRAAPKKDGKMPRWIMAAEIMETARLYARTCARLDPLWALDLAGHLVKVAHSEPFWNPEGGRVLVKQRTRLYGLELESRSVGYGRIDPVAATDIFIREALVNDTVTWPFDFLTHNRGVREEIENLLTRARDSGYMNLDEAVYRFYASRLLPQEDSPGEGLSSVAELIDLVRERRSGEPRFLMMEPDDLRDPAELQPDPSAFPTELPLENSALPLAYAYKPGQVDDGVTLNVSVAEASALTPVELDWAVPGHLAHKVEHFLRATPKELRRAFAPLAETAKSMAAQLAQRDRLTGRRETLTQALAAQLSERFGIQISETIWSGRQLPDHLRVRVRVVDEDGREVCASRELAQVQAGVAGHQRELSTDVARADPPAWRAARERWETAEQATWTFGEIPWRVRVTEQAGVPVFAFPGLKAGAEGVALRLYKTTDEAGTATQAGLAKLLELALRYELAWFQKDLRALRELGAVAATLAPTEALQADAYACLSGWVCDAARVVPARSDNVDAEASGLAEGAFAGAVERAKLDLRGLVPRLVDLLRVILDLRASLQVHPHPYKGLEAELGELLPPDFLRRVTYTQLAHFPRYLKAMKMRADRWRQNPTKDAERAKQIAPYLAALKRLPTRRAPDEGQGGAGAASFDTFRWLVEEFRVSLFAQELGTPVPVSAVKLDRVLDELERKKGGRVDAPPSPQSPVSPQPVPPVPTPVFPLAAAKGRSLKSFGALNALFRQ